RHQRRAAARARPVLIDTATLPGPGRARRGASGSLNPQAAIAGPNTARGADSSGPGLAHVASTVRFRALGASEPRQIREEAALRSLSQVPRLGLTRAGDASAARGTVSKAERAAGPAILASREWLEKSSTERF